MRAVAEEEAAATGMRASGKNRQPGSICSIARQERGKFRSIPPINVNINQVCIYKSIQKNYKKSCICSKKLRHSRIPSQVNDHI
jgi:hypothetical protein